MTTLAKADIGKVHRISEITGDPILRERLQEMGFASAEEVEVFFRLPWRGPLVVSVRGTHVALRISEAECIHIQSHPTM